MAKVTGLKGIKMKDLAKRAEMRIHFVGVSHDAKTGVMSATYSSFNLCPLCCVLRDDGEEGHGGCYAAGGHCRIHFAAVSAGLTGVAPSELKKVIEETPHCNIVRHNVAGDIATPGTSDIDEELLDTLCDAYKGLKAYTYTHCQHTKRNFDLMKKAIDNGFVINSSCETMEQVKKAMDADIPAVIAVNTMKSKVATVEGVKVVKCPNADDKSKQCINCRLCMMAKRNFAVAFPVHGVKKATATKSGNLIDIEQEGLPDIPPGLNGSGGTMWKPFHNKKYKFKKGRVKIMKKETITERVKGLLFANAECAELCRLDVKFTEMDEKEREGLLRIARNSEQKVLVLLEVLGSRVGDKIISDGTWSARERFAEWHNLDKYKIAGF